MENLGMCNKTMTTCKTLKDSVWYKFCVVYWILGSEDLLDCIFLSLEIFTDKLMKFSFEVSPWPVVESDKHLQQATDFTLKLEAAQM